jgi:hypothetical protein
MNASQLSAIRVNIPFLKKCGVPKFAYYFPKPDDTTYRVAILLIDPVTSEKIATVSLNVDTPAGVNHVWLRCWSENDGIPEEIEKSGLVVLLDEFRPTGFCLARKAQLTPLGIEELQRQSPKKPPLKGVAA